MSELKLLPCPWCGGEAEEDINENGHRVIQCAKCTACVGTMEEVVKKWNTRAIPELPPVSPEDLVEGEWYAVGDVPTWYRCGRFHTFFEDGTSRVGFWPEEGIYGPLKFKIGGAESTTPT